MRQIRYAALCVALLAASGTLVAGASAEAPEFGRCLKVAPKSLSNYDNTKCVKTASEDAGTEEEKLKKGNYQWFPGVVKSNFTFQVKEGTLVLLESVAGTKITCSGGTGAGKYTGSKTVGAVVVKLTKCEPIAGQCTSSGEPAGTVTTAELSGLLGIWQKGTTRAKDKPGLSLKPTVGEYLAQFVCGSIAVKVRGAVIVPLPGNAMKLSTTLKLAQAKGKQKPEKFVEGPAEVLETSFAGGPFEQTGFALALIQTNEEKVAVNTVV
jgi:hypothetical protein